MPILLRATLLWLLLVVGSFAGRPAAALAEFLDPEEAFRVSAELDATSTLGIEWQIAEGYKLYREMIAFSVQEGSAELGAFELPEGIESIDPSTGETVAIYHGTLRVQVPLASALGPFTLAVSHQGCAEDGLCYPPATTLFRVDPTKSGALVVAGAMDAFSAYAEPAEEEASTPEQPVTAAGEQDMAASMLQEGNFWKISLAFFVFGLLLSFTPCILPMVPILSSIIAGEGDGGRGKSFLLALVYSLGMALVYTILGVAAGLAGEGLAGFLQQPAVLISFAVLLVLLSLSMFDLYQLQVPPELQCRLTQASGKGAGRFAGVFLMGSVSALVVGPCVAAPLAGTLVYISQTRDVVLGGFALFSMAIGMSVPLLLIGLSAGFLLPKVGPWMVGVKYLFGILLIAVAIWMVSPVLPAPAVLLLWGALAILSAVFLGLFEPLAGKPSVGARFAKAFALLLFLLGLLELVGAASGARNPLEPLARLGGGAPATSKAPGLAFTRIDSIEELEQALSTSGRPVMLDFYADWCVSCKELDHLTFQHPEVSRRLDDFLLLQADVTDNTEEHRELMKRFGLFGPPAVLFFDAGGTEQAAQRVVGFLPPEAFLQRLDALR